MTKPIYRDYTLCATLTPTEAAEVVSQMDDKEQARFISEMGRLTEDWDHPACFQWQYVIDNFIKPEDSHDRLTQAEIDCGRRFMRNWIEYFECVVNPTAVDLLEELQRENSQLKDKLRTIREGLQGMDAPGARVQPPRVRVEPGEGQEP